MWIMRESCDNGDFTTIQKKTLSQIISSSRRPSEVRGEILCYYNNIQIISNLLFPLSVRARGSIAYAALLRILLRSFPRYLSKTSSTFSFVTSNSSKVFISEGILGALSDIHLFNASSLEICPSRTSLL